MGDGPSREALQHRIGAIAHFAGYRQGADLADHYAAADLFAFSSVTETLGNVVLEAMSSGLPVIALRAGGVGETIESGRNGILVEPGEPPERFAAAICWLIDQTDERHKMAEAARTYAISQSWEAIMAALRMRYQDAIDKSVDLCSLKIESY